MVLSLGPLLLRRAPASSPITRRSASSARQQHSSTVQAAILIVLDELCAADVLQTTEVRSLLRLGVPTQCHGQNTAFSLLIDTHLLNLQRL